MEGKPMACTTILVGKAASYDGSTMIVAETALGRMTHKIPVSAYAHFGKGKGCLLYTSFYWTVQ